MSNITHVRKMFTGEEIDVPVPPLVTSLGEAFVEGFIKEYVKNAENKIIIKTAAQVDIDAALPMFPGSEIKATGKDGRRILVLNGETIAKQGESWADVLLRAEKTLEALKVFQTIMPTAKAEMDKAAKKIEAIRKEREKQAQEVKDNMATA